MTLNWSRKTDRFSGILEPLGLLLVLLSLAGLRIMTSLLKRLSISLDRQPTTGGPRDQAAGLVSHPSFNDFSFHVNSEVHEGALDLPRGRLGTVQRVGRGPMLTTAQFALLCPVQWRSSLGQQHR